MFHDIHEECGVFGIYGHPEAANLTYLGLYAFSTGGRKAQASAHPTGDSSFLKSPWDLLPISSVKKD